ncbi:hypothetical protein L195_g027357 [Trifolium pratense]|uniref:Uncharacterized protein n=2 Tax=Trifolium pratense TaxID=57577 RepID=A0A2K3KYX2_TRIPR|nr:hypothetical protein L195_g027357 [Trifolium pratense]CAJ2667903.1 unnamed protein product [Trifolium pratense]
MENQNIRYRGWCPSNSYDYQVHEVTEPMLRKRHDRPKNHKKGHVAFKTVLEEPITPVEEEPSVAESETTSTERVNSFESVDQKADVFIKMEHRRIQFARLKSLGLA